MNQDNRSPLSGCAAKRLIGQRVPRLLWQLELAPVRCTVGTNAARGLRSGSGYSSRKHHTRDTAGWVRCETRTLPMRTAARVASSGATPAAAAALGPSSGNLTRNLRWRGMGALFVKQWFHLGPSTVALSSITAHYSLLGSIMVLLWFITPYYGPITVGPYICR